MIVRVVAYMLATCVAALLVGTISEQRLVAYETRTALFVFAALLGIINAAIRPVLVMLTLPVGCLAFGLTALGLNAGLFALAAWLTPGLRVTPAGAVIGAIATSIASGIIYSLLDEVASSRTPERV
ncbi:MAG: phage holin family protein [Chloroflexia bacterium]|nr:phage holin family protein [Chloroflexia bacterium]